MKRYNMITKEEKQAGMRILSVEDYESSVGKWVKFLDIEGIIKQNKEMLSMMSDNQAISNGF